MKKLEKLSPLIFPVLLMKSKLPNSRRDLELSVKLCSHRSLPRSSPVWRDIPGNTRLGLGTRPIVSFYLVIAAFFGRINVIFQSAGLGEGILGLVKYSRSRMFLKAKNFTKTTKIQRFYIGSVLS